MLSRADAEIVRRDSRLPGLAMLLDDELLLAALRAACPDHSIAALEISYARYRPGLTCLVACRLDVDGSRVAMYATTYPADATIPVAMATRLPAVPSLLGPGRFALGDGDTVVTMFPNDRRVTSLAAIGQPVRYKAMLDELFPLSESWSGEVEPLAYRPERGFVGRLTGSDGRHSVLKLYTKRNYAVAPQHSNALVPRSWKVPRVVARSDRYFAIMFEWVEGSLLNEAIQDPRFEVSTMFCVGEALAELHQQNLTEPALMTSAAIAADLRVNATIIGHLCPPLHESARHIADRLGARVLEQPPVHYRLHGDLHPRQVVLTGGAVAFLDVNEGVSGDPAHELGTFLAYLEREVVHGGLPQRRARALEEALLDGYENSPRLPVRARVPLAQAVGLFRLASRCFRHRERDWSERMTALLGRAEELTANLSRNHGDA